MKMLERFILSLAILGGALILTHTASTRSAIGAKVEVRAGSLAQKLETYSASPARADIHVGFGKRRGAGAVRLLWPAST